jgi:viroplasmin and RNaseH domain-containing protein
MKNYYGVRKGRVPGVYKDWESCRAQVEKCANEFRGFDTYHEAAAYVAQGETVLDIKHSAEWERKRKRKHTRTPYVYTPGRGVGSDGADTKWLQGISANNVATEPHIKSEPLDASQSYFSQVPNFEPNKAADFDEEFGRFASSQNIAPGSHAWRQQRTSAIRRKSSY